MHHSSFLTLDEISFPRCFLTPQNCASNAHPDIPPKILPGLLIALHAVLDRSKMKQVAKNASSAAPAHSRAIPKARLLASRVCQDSTKTKKEKRIANRARQANGAAKFKQRMKMIASIAKSASFQRF